MRTYETVFIIDPDLSEEDSEKTIKRIETLIEGQKGVIVLWDRWGKRKLAYRVKKKSKGNYVRVVYYGKPAIVALLEKNMRIMEDILKFLTIVLADKEIVVTLEEKREELRDGNSDYIPRHRPMRDDVSEVRDGKDIVRESASDETDESDEGEEDDTAEV